MNKFLRRIAGVALAALFLVAPVASFAAPTAVPIPDSSDILGINPGLLYGVSYDQYQNTYKQIVDSTATTPAAIGKWVYFTGSTWIQAATANLAAHPGMYGVVVVAATAQGGNAIIQTQGLNTAVSVKTGGSTACAATGDVPMAITTTGDVTPTTAATVPGATWGFCTQVLAISQPATLISAYIGGY